MTNYEPVICCKNIEIEGHIAFGHGCVIHPECSLRAETGRMMFGEFNIVEERVRLSNRKLGNQTMNIGGYNIFEVGSVIESSDIGSCNVFQHRCKVGPDCRIGNYCIISAGTVLKPGMVVPDYTVVYGDCRMRSNPNPQEDLLRQHVRSLYSTLAKIIPAYNALQQIQS